MRLQTKKEDLHLHPARCYCFLGRHYDQEIKKKYLAAQNRYYKNHRSNEAVLKQ